MENNAIVLQKEPNSPVSEAFRNIRSSILFSNIDETLKKIVVTSANKAEGKSTITINTAYAMAELNHKVLLVDCDLRKPSIHKKLKLSNQLGLTDILLNKDDYKSYVHSVTENFNVITSGTIPNNPSEIVNSKAMQHFIETVATDYDYVFIDAPPLIVTDPVILSTIADGIIFVVDSGHTEIELAQRGVQKLKAANANIIGTILNKVSNKTSSYGYYYYSYYTDDEGNRKKKKHKREA